MPFSPAASEFGKCPAPAVPRLFPPRFPLYFGQEEPSREERFGSDRLPWVDLENCKSGRIGLNGRGAGLSRSSFRCCFGCRAGQSRPQARFQFRPVGRRCSSPDTRIRITAAGNGNAAESEAELKAVSPPLVVVSASALALATEGVPRPIGYRCSFGVRAVRRVKQSSGGRQQQGRVVRDRAHAGEGRAVERICPGPLACLAGQGNAANHGARVCISYVCSAGTVIDKCRHLIVAALRAR